MLNSRVGGAGEAGRRASASSPGPDNLLFHHPAVRCSGNRSASSSIWRARAAVVGIRCHATGSTIFTLAESRISKSNSSRHRSSASHPTGAAFVPVPSAFGPGTRASHQGPDDSARSQAGGCPAVTLHPAPGTCAIPRRFPHHAAPRRRRPSNGEGDRIQPSATRTTAIPSASRPTLISAMTRRTCTWSSSASMIPEKCARACPGAKTSSTTIKSRSFSTHSTTAAAPTLSRRLHSACNGTPSGPKRRVRSRRKVTSIPRLTRSGTPKEKLPAADLSFGWRFPSRACAFPPDRQQEWGIILYRGITRKTEDAFWPHVSYRIEGRLGQAATLYGLEGISPGRDIELIPYGVMRGFRALDTRDFSNPYFQKATVQGQPGMDAKFVFHDHFTLDLTANPDFSQVESEDPQITVNQRYAVYFPEKRPFFLENEDFFRTPMDLFFTRNIGDPSAGIRLTGKDGPYSLGVMTADDRSPGLAIPAYYPLSGLRSYFTVARVSRDIFRQSSVGALYTDWECPTTGEYNRVGGVDTRLKFSPNWTLDGQAVTSSSNIFGNFLSPTTPPTTAKPTTIPFSSGNLGNTTQQSLRRTRRETATPSRRPALHLRRNLQRRLSRLRLYAGFHQSRGHSRDQPGVGLPLPPPPRMDCRLGPIAKRPLRFRSHRPPSRYRLHALLSQFRAEARRS